ncbi:type II and III secretion system protein family protein [uncultured Sneathiella sp.]|uniref:type II and III secretion system protein family protein n=1 Tax=uncultured Sneathiella sp. TaxID=879315 RepID=UPI002595AFA9|nr:type II and III secretion system protein family protein [uncultured Sneathiella sp.]
MVTFYPETRVRKNRIIAYRIPGILTALFFGAMITTQMAPGAMAAQASRVNLSLSEIGRSDENTSVGVPINKSRILKVDVPFADLLVGNPEIADVLPLTDKTVYILGKTLGTTSLAVYGKKKQLLGIVDIEVTFDIESLKSKLNQLVPDEIIEIYTANGSVVLKGLVANAAHVDKILSVAEKYAPGNVTNLISVRSSQQVMLKVKFAEVSRSTLKNLSTGIGGLLDKGATTGGFSAGVGVVDQILDPGFFSGAVSFAIGNSLLDLFFDAGEEKGVVKTLAEPNLIALSGETAVFLAGGEFPIPVAQDADASNPTITVEYKEFGVKLAFTPSVLEDELINLVVAPEVSSLAGNTVQVSGFEIPALTVRRARTTVDLRAGQSFAIAGLLQSNFRDTVDQIPGLGNVPVLGALARSSEFAQEETELVIIITPYLVQPAVAGTLAAPTDYFLPPSDIEIFFSGKTEADNSGIRPPPSGRQLLSDRGDGGIEGKFGYVIK